MKYDPDKHQRRSMRLPSYNYAAPGADFVTICAYGGACLFGEVVDGAMSLGDYGRVVATMWQRIPRHFPHVGLDEWVVMPNHVHGIIVILGAPGTGDAFPGGRSREEGVTPDESTAATEGDYEECIAPTSGSSGAPTSGLPGALTRGSLGAIVGNFKSVTARRINRMRKTPGAPVWQRNYYDRVIHDDEVLQEIRRYILENPRKWELDRENPALAKG